MLKKQEIQFSKANRNYFLNMATLLPFVLLLASGILVLRYHGGMDYNKLTLGLNGNQWLKAHQLLALVVIPLVMLHLWLHGYWLKKLFRLKKASGKNHDMNLALFIVFVLTVLTALISWLVFDGKPAADLLREIHNKLGLALLFFFAIHLINYFKWLANMTRKNFSKEKRK